MAGAADLLFRPTFDDVAQAPPGPAPPEAGPAPAPAAPAPPPAEPPTSPDAVAGIKTYRYLRLGMVIVVVAILASIGLQVGEVGCWQGSISAYYYSPARAVFVSGMVAIGVSLIVIKGSTVLEDVFLAVAGILAPVVAFVPTTFEKTCVRGQALEEGVGGKLPGPIALDAQNNVAALIIAGIVALGVGTIVLWVDWRGGQAGSSPWARALVLAGTGVVLVVAVVLWATDTILDLHGWVAVGMFAFLALASLWSGLWVWWSNRELEPADRTAHRKVYVGAYVGVAAAMVVLGVVIKFVVPDPWLHRTLVLEVVEIGLFVIMWVVQSFERWGRVVQV